MSHASAVQMHTRMAMFTRHMHLQQLYVCSAAGHSLMQETVRGHAQ
jgi:hypothetical protein